ncbi:hypothetical protein C0991_005700, partial [Blastosporella zonata]
MMTIAPGFATLLVINIFFLVSTELALHRNQALLRGTADSWTFGQVLSLMLLLVPAWSFVGILFERRDSRVKKIKALMEGSVAGDRDKALELLDEQPDVAMQVDYALIRASANGHQKVVEVLYDVSRGDDYSGVLVAYLLAVYRQDLPIVQWLAAKNLGIKDTGFREALISSVQSKSEDVMKVLAELAIGIKIKDVELQRAYANAAGNGLEAVVEILKKVVGSTRINECYKLGETPLHRAAAGGYLKIVQDFITNGDFDVNVKSDTGDTALHRAVDRGYLEVVKGLLASGASVDAKDHVGDTPLHNAVGQGHLEIVKELLASHASVDAK